MADPNIKVQKAIQKSKGVEERRVEKASDESMQSLVTNFLTQQQAVGRLQRTIASARYQSVPGFRFDERNALDHPAQMGQIAQPITGTSNTINSGAIAPNPVYMRLRYYRRESYFLNSFMPLRLAIQNYGLRLVPYTVGEDEASKQDKVALRKWLDQVLPQKMEVFDILNHVFVEVEQQQTNEERIRKVLDDMWNDFNLFDAVVGFWMEGQNYVLNLPLERVQYQDSLAMPLLRFIHGLSRYEIMQINNEDQQDRFLRHPIITVDSAYGEHYKLIKRANDGDGLGYPSLYSLLRTLGEAESKEFGTYATSSLMRHAVRQHKLGHEIKSGDRAGKPLHFPKEPWFEAVRNTFVDMQGPDEVTTRFDHNIEYPMPNLELFDQVMWNGSDTRMLRWMGPVAAMFYAKPGDPVPWPMIRASVISDRIKFKPLERAINAAFQPPVKLQFRWSNSLFNDSRLQAEMMRYGFQSGNVSNQTLIEELGYDAELEGERKETAAADPKAQERYTPLFDISHGTMPALDQMVETAAMGAQRSAGGGKGMQPGQKNGKPSGGKDKS